MVVPVFKIMDGDCQWADPQADTAPGIVAEISWVHRERGDVRLTLRKFGSVLEQRKLREAVPEWQRQANRNIKGRDSCQWRMN